MQASVCVRAHLCVFVVFEKKNAPGVLLSCMEIRKSTTEKQVIEAMGEEVGDATEETEGG